MEQFAFDFLMTMIHSVWQTAILLCIYYIVTLANKSYSPLAKRNLLFAFMLVQVMISVATFFLLQASFIGIISTAGILTPFVQMAWLKEYATLLLGLYFSFILVRSFRTFISWRKFKAQLPSSFSKTPVALQRCMATHSSILGIRKKVQIWCSTAVHSPLTFGFWKPMILLPAVMLNDITIEQTESIILHELAHIRQHDYLLNWLLLFSETIFFFNPFMHIMAGKIKLEREKNCDSIVLRFRPDAVGYAETLLQISKMRGISLPMQLAAVTPRKALLKRVLFFTNPTNLEFNNNQFVLSPVALLLGIMLNLVIIFSLIPKQPGTLQEQLPVAIELNSGNTNLETPALIRQQEPVLASLAEQDAVIQKSKRKIRKQHQTAMTEVEPENFMETLPENTIPFFQASSREKEITGKEFVLTNKAANGAVLTAKYRAILIDGIWILEPVWMKTDVPWNAKDSLTTSSDSLILLYPVVQ